MRGMWRIKRLLEDRRARRALARARRLVARYPVVKTRRPHGLPGPLIVSLTSYPARYPTLALTLKSLLDQQVAADQTILWLGENDYEALPESVTALVADGLEIRSTRDVRSYTKPVPALAAKPEAFIATADDDVHYPPDWLGRLVAGALANPSAIVTLRAHLADCHADGTLTAYADWELETGVECSPNPLRPLFATGVGGVLYPPGALHPDTQDIDAFMDLAPHADDVWFFWMAARQGTAVVRAPGRFDIVNWPLSQETALMHENLYGNRNDVQIRAMEQRFGPVVATTG